MSYAIAVIGATGNVGQEVLNILFERRFPIKSIHAVASSSSVGRKVSFGEGETLTVESLEHFEFKNIDFAFFCAGSEVSKKYAKKAVQQGVTVIDKASHFRLDANVPLIVPEVNGKTLEKNKAQLIASPNCIAIPLAMALKPLHDIATIKRVVLSTYQSVSGAGKAAMDELFNQTRGIMMNTSNKAQVFTKPIAFNVIPHIDDFRSDGFTGEEAKVIAEIQKIIDSKIQVVATCVRVPVFIGHSLSVMVEFENEILPAQARQLLGKMPGILVIDRPDQNGYITPSEIAGEDDVVVSRIRKDPTVPYGLCMWIVGDNLRKGAALNAVQIAESLIG